MHKDKLLASEFKGKGKVDISRFKGLGEMPAAQLKETTMDPKTRTLLRVTLPDQMASLGLSDDLEPDLNENIHNDVVVFDEVADLVERLMGKNAEARFNFIQENAEFVDNIDV